MNAIVQQVNPNKALWEKGDFTRIAVSMRESGEALVRTLGVERGLKVLDLGCGYGEFINHVRPKRIPRFRDKRRGTAA